MPHTTAVLCLFQRCCRCPCNACNVQAEKARQAEAEKVAKEAAKEAERVAREAAKAAEAAEKARLKAEKEAQVGASNTQQLVDLQHVQQPHPKWYLVLLLLERLW